MQRCADVRSQLLCYWTVLEMNYCWACITLMASYFAKLCRLTSCSPLSFFSHRLFCRHSRKQNLVAHFETMALQLYMMFLAFSMQLVSPKQWLCSPLFLDFLCLHLCLFLSTCFRTSGMHHMDCQAKQLVHLVVCFAMKLLVMVVNAAVSL